MPTPARGFVRLLRRHAALIRLQEQSLARDRGISPTDVRCLGEFADAPELTAKELTHRLGLCHSRLSHVLDSLEARGLVARRINEADRRIIDVTLSDSGREFVELLEGGLAACYGQALGALPRRSTATAAAVLARALETARPAVHEAFLEKA